MTCIFTALPHTSPSANHQAYLKTSSHFTATNQPAGLECVEWGKHVGFLSASCRAVKTTLLPDSFMQKQLHRISTSLDLAENDQLDLIVYVQEHKLVLIKALCRSNEVRLSIRKELLEALTQETPSIYAGDFWELI